MLGGFRWLALETWFLDPAIAYYRDVLDRPVDRRGEGHAVVDVGAHAIHLREPGPVPRGGLHVHYALATTPAHFDDWYDTLAAAGDVWDHEFGDTRSVYGYDPDDHCIEIGTVAEGDAALGGVFEVALEVEALDRATAFYEALGFEVVDRGTDRRRHRLDGPIAVELWEPQRGIAEARGGVHTHLGFAAADPTAAVAPITTTATAVDDIDDGVRVRDPDGHYLTITTR